MADQKDNDWVKIAAQASSVGIVMVVSVLIGIGAGLWLDNRLGTTPAGMIIGSMLGMISGFYSVWLIMKDLMKN